MNGPVHASAPREPGIGGVHDGIHVLAREIADDELNSGFANRGQHEGTRMRKQKKRRQVCNPSPSLCPEKLNSDQKEVSLTMACPLREPSQLSSWA